MNSSQIEKNLKILRKYHDFTQEDMSVILNISRSCYTMYEIGMRRPDLEMLFTLSEKFSIPLDCFFYESSKFMKVLLEYDVLSSLKP